LEEKLEEDLPYIIDAHKEVGPVKAEYFNKPGAAKTTGWVDYAFRWLTAEEEAAFHLPGPNSAKRSEFLTSFIIITPLLAIQHGLNLIPSSGRLGGV
jgi:hypothetical protein